MPEIIKVYRQSLGAMRFIGKRYTNADRDQYGMFGAKWGEWVENGWFDALHTLMPAGFKAAYDEGDAPIGLMCEKDQDFNNFEYWIGFFMPENTPVPEGFQYVDFPSGDIGVCWIYGPESEVFGQEAMCLDRLRQEGFENVTDWCFERNVLPRSETPDEKGNIIMDICFFVK